MHKLTRWYVVASSRPEARIDLPRLLTLQMRP